MRFALYAPNFGPFGDARVLSDMAAEAERAGWDGFFIWDHIAGDAYSRIMVDPWVALAAMALKTTTIRIGALVTPIPRRRPWKVARETVSIDHLSGGRLIFGAGSGGVGAEWERFGEVDHPVARGEMLDEGLDILTGLWSGDPYTLEGKHYTVENQQFLPKPFQQPRIPIWIAGKWPHKKPIIRALRYDGVFPIIANDPSYLNPPSLKALEEYRAISNWILPRMDANHPIDLVCRGNSKNDCDDDMRLIQEYQNLGYTWWLEHLVPEVFGGHLLGDWQVDRMMQRISDGPPPADRVQS